MLQSRGLDRVRCYFCQLKKLKGMKHLRHDGSRQGKSQTQQTESPVEERAFVRGGKHTTDTTLMEEPLRMEEELGELKLRWLEDVRNFEGSSSPNLGLVKGALLVKEKPKPLPGLCFKLVGFCFRSVG